MLELVYKNSNFSGVSFPSLTLCLQISCHLPFLNHYQEEKSYLGLMENNGIPSASSKLPPNCGSHLLCFYYLICRLSSGGLTGSGFGPYYRRRRITRWVAGILRQPRWRCLQDTVGDSVIELRYRCCFWKLYFFPL
jgi:hypothetical protein